MTYTVKWADMPQQGQIVPIRNDNHASTCQMTAPQTAIISRFVLFVALSDRFPWLARMNAGQIAWLLPFTGSICSAYLPAFYE